MAGLLDTLPPNGDILEYMAGAVAFHRSFPEVCESIWDYAMEDPGHAAALLDAELNSRRSEALRIAKAAIVDVFGGGCTSSEMAAALDGFRREASVTLAGKLEAVADRSGDFRP